MKSAIPYCDFFLNPALPRHKWYEIARARFVEKKTVQQISEQFGMPFNTVQCTIRDFKDAFDKNRPIEFFIQRLPGPKNSKKKNTVHVHVVNLRKLGYASTDILKALHSANYTVSLSLIDQVLRKEGLAGLKKRTVDERKRIADEIRSGGVPGLTTAANANVEVAQVANVSALNLESGRSVSSRLAGVFLLVPFLVNAGLDKVVTAANMIGTKMIPSVNYLLSMLALKLLDKERKSHIGDWNCDEGLGLFAGLNVLPKTTAITDYSYRLVDNQHTTLLTEWVRNAYPILCPEGAKRIALDFHTIAHRGKDSVLENNYLPLRGKALPSVLACFARCLDTPMLCYANADVISEEKAEMPLRFIDYWKDITGEKPEWLYFDSKMTTYAVLDKLNSDSDNKTNFITIRRHGSTIIAELLNLPDNQWKSAVVDTPQRRHQKIKYWDTVVKLTDYRGTCRQIAVKGMGRSMPTLFLTNNEAISARNVVIEYAQRNRIENDLGNNVNFFHMDCLSSDVRLNVNLDVVMTTIANGCYRWLAQQLKGFKKMEPKKLFRTFVETSGSITVNGEYIDVRLARRSHNPVIGQALKNTNNVKIPWLENKILRISFD